MATKQSIQQSGHRVFLTGVLVFVLGSGPLLMTIALAKLGWTSDPNPNPILFGMMAMLTFWPGILMMLTGLVMTWFGKQA